MYDEKEYLLMKDEDLCHLSNIREKKPLLAIRMRNFHRFLFYILFYMIFFIATNFIIK